MKFPLMIAILAFAAIVAATPTKLPVSGPSTVPKYELPSIQITPPEPGSTWSAAYLYRFTKDKDDRGAAGALNRWKTFDLGGGVRIELDAFGGVTVRRKAPIAALLGGVRKAFGRDVEVYAGAGWTIVSGQPSAPCVGFGISARF